MKKSYQPFLIKPDGEKQEVNPKNGTDFSLEELQGFVGGYVQILHMGRGELMVVNEEGKLKNLPRNRDATALAYYKGRLFKGDYIVGTVLICHKSQIK